MAMTKTNCGPLMDRKMRWLLGAAVVVLLVLWFLFAPGRGYLHYRKLHCEVESLARENSRLEAKNAELVKDIRRLKSDEAYIEDVARKKHGLLKKDEMVYDFEPAVKKK